MMNKEFVEK